MGGIPTPAAAQAVADAVERNADGFEIMFEGPDGWSDWIHPAPGYRLQCCDCGLVHDMQFAVVKATVDDAPFNDGEGPEGVAVFRARRVAQ